jgi:adenylate cyclase
MTSRSDSRLIRLDLARLNEERVLAESALQGERTVAKIRLLTIVLVTGSQWLAQALHGTFGHGDPVRGLAGGLYLLYALGAALAVHRRRVGSPVLALWLPLGMTFVDFGFFAFMGMRTWAVEGVVQPQMGAAVMGLVLCWSVARYSWIHVVQSTALACIAFMAVGVYAGRDTELAGNLFTIGCFCALGALIGFTRVRVRRMFVDLRRRDNLARFLPPQVAERVLSLGQEALAPTQREVTVMFTDLRDFTSLSEQLQPAEVLRLLDDYFGRMGRLVKAHEGIVNKFLGDGMLAVWGVPERLEDHAGRALACALEMRLALAELNEERSRRHEAPLRMGIGLHTGVVAAGMLGGAEQHEYTVIGDAVNLASRIEGLTKEHGTDLLVSEATWRLVEGRFAGARVTEQPVKGRREPVVVYRVDAATQTPIVERPLPPQFLPVPRGRAGAG